MVRKVKKKKTGIRIFAELLLMVFIAAFVYRSIITPGNHQIFEKKYDDGTTAVPPSIEHDLSVPISPDKLRSPNAILIRLTDDTVLMQKIAKIKFILLL